MKKIKKTVPFKPGDKPSELLKFLKGDDKEESKEKKLVYPNVPVKNWTEKDFFKYYLDTYKSILGFEDPLYRRRTSKTAPEADRIRLYLREVFDNDRADLKSFIKWIIEWWVSEDSFVDGNPEFWAIFTEKRTFAGKYFSSKTTKKKILKKVRKDVDNKMASKDSWDSYFGDDD